MKKILVITTVGINFGGITSVIYNYCCNMNRDGLEMDFLSPTQIPDNLKKNFENIGSVYEVPNRQKNLRKYMKSLATIIHNNRYDVVHIHGNSGTMFFDALVAKWCGVKQVIVHGHSTSCNHPELNKVLVPLMKMCATTWLTCSEAAGQWLYGSNYMVLNNAIQLEKFQYNETVRQKYRKELNIENQFVIGHIGMFTETKNHDFIIDFFRSILEHIPDVCLMLVSDGPKMEYIMEKVSRLGIEEHVKFLGKRTDVAMLYQAMDLFVLPSKWEGLPVVMLEAQAAGLPVLASDTVTRDACCLDSTFYKSLSDGAESWADKILEIRASQFDRSIPVASQIAEKGFDIKEEAEKLRKIYLQ